MPKHPETVTLDAFTGLNNKQPPERMSEADLEIAENIDIDHTGKASQRQGFTTMIATTDGHSLWSNEEDEAYYVDDGTLYKVDWNNQTVSTAISSSLSSGRYSYIQVEDKTYFSNLKDNGVIQNDQVRTWGIEAPSLSPLVSVVGGGLPPGEYNGAIRYRATDGRVSGAGGRFYAETSAVSSGIHVFGIPTIVGHYTDVFLNTPNGEVLYYVGSVPHGVTTFDITNMHGKVVPLDFEFVEPAQPMELMQIYRGRMYGARGNALLYSEPHSYEHFHRSNFIQFDGEITNIMPVDDGIFVTADRLYFLEGREPATFNVREREKYTSAKYTAVKIIGGDVVLENIPTGTKWLFTSDKGIVMVGTGGMVFNLTEKKVMVDDAEMGAAIFRSVNGINQYLSVLKDPKSDRLHMGDTVTADVIRNGIAIT